MIEVTRAVTTAVRPGRLSTRVQLGSVEGRRLPPVDPTSLLVGGSLARATTSNGISTPESRRGSQDQHRITLET